MKNYKKEKQTELDPWGKKKLLNHSNKSNTFERYLGCMVKYITTHFKGW